MRKLRARITLSVTATALVTALLPAASQAASPSPGPSAPPPIKPGPVGPAVAPLFPDPGQPPTAQVPLPYSANDFRFSVLAHGAYPNNEFAQHGFIEPPADNWQPGLAPFGTAGACSIGSRIGTPWTLDRDLFARRSISVVPGQSYEVAVAIDNDIQVFWDGTALTGQPVPHENCPVEDTFVFVVPAALVQSPTPIIAVRAVDHGVEDFMDISVRVSALGASPEQRFGRCGPDPEQNVAPTCQAEPVNTFTGAYTNSVTDLALPGRGLPVNLVRNYSSADSTSGPFGLGWHHGYEQHLTFNPDGSITLTDANGNAIPFLADGNGGTYRAKGVLSSLTPVVGGGFEVQRLDLTKSKFDAAGRLTAEVDRSGNQIGFAYTGSDLTTITDTVGRSIALTYDPSTHLLTEVQDPLGHHVVYTYSGGRLATVKDLADGVTTYGYDANGRLASILDPNNHFLMRTTYGADGRVSQQLDARGNPTTFSWDAGTRTSTMTDARNGQWIDTFNADGTPATQRDPLGNTRSYTYDATLNVATVTDARGHVTTNTWDGRGHLVKTVAPAPLGYVSSYEYDEHGNRHRITDGRGLTTWFDYDGTNNLIRITLPLPGSPMKTFGYDVSGNGLLRTETDFRGKTTSYDYDSQANRTRVTTPLGFKTTMTYDANGRIATMVDPRGNVAGANPLLYTTTFTYDGLGRPLTVTDALNHSTTTVYDPAGNRTSVTDANQHATTYGYDEANHLTSVTDPRLKVTGYAYDAVGNLTSRTDANQHVTTFGYDLAHRMTSETRPSSRLWTYGYDANGNRTSIVDAIGNATPQSGDGTTTFTYDNLDRLTGVTYSDATPAVAFGYDGDGNRTSMTDPTQSTYTYDEVNRLKQVIRTGISQLDYTYDANDNVLTRTPSGGAAVIYTYDDDGRMATAVSGGQTTSYAYDAAANEITATLPAGNGYVESRTYDNAGRLTEVKSQKGATVLSKSTYTLDPVGNRSTIVTTTGTTTLTYDANDRLTQACYTVACTGSDNFRRYTYDDVGNRLTEVSAAGTTTYTYDVLDQLVSSSGVGGNVTYTFNLDGDQTASGAQTMTYDLAHRLKTLTSGSTTTTYTYAGDGARVEASTGTQASKKTRFVWDPNRPIPELVRELDGNNAAVRDYQYGLDLISMKSGTSSYYFHHDGLGSVMNLTSSTGVTQWTYDYHPFGVARTTTKNSNQAPTNVIQFAGEYFDPTGLYHLRARQYAPSTGRFLTVDPVRTALRSPASSGYRYADDNPAARRDPTGLDTGGLCFSIAGAFGLGAGEQICLVITGEGEIGITGTTGYGAGTPSLSVTAGVQHTSGNSILDVAGPFGYAGASAGEGVVGGLEGFTGTDRCGNPISGGTASAGFGVEGVPFAEGHVGRSQTDILLDIDLGGLFGDTDAPCGAQK